MSDFEQEILELPGRRALEIQTLRNLSHRVDRPGLFRVLVHLGAMAGTGTAVWLARERPALMLLAMALHGATIVTMFAPMHECVHRTAFKSQGLNLVIGWLAGVLSFYNFHYYRRYHLWHHRYTQDRERDPELARPKPQTVAQYVWQLSGAPFWIAKPRELLALAWGDLRRNPYVTDATRGAVVWSARAQLGVYVTVAAISLATGAAAALQFWLLPAVLAQPLLRALLIVEHTGCAEGSDGLTNTRTTLASWPLRMLMWNMPFHAEHHLYPSIPFHRLPAAHRALQGRFAHVASGYPAANWDVIQSLGASRDHDWEGVK